MSMNEDVIRADCKDIWNSFMVRDANFSTSGIPTCPTTAVTLPNELISYPNARALVNKHRKNGDAHFFSKAFVHFYVHDHKFDGNVGGVWHKPRKAAEVLRHFAGIITPDFSTYLDFPFPLKIYNTYRMRAFGYWYGEILGNAVINNVRWGEEDSFSYCFDGIEHNSIVSIGTVASGLRESCNRRLFEVGFFKMIEVLKPEKIIVYGSDKYPWFDEVRQDIRIIQFDSDTAKRWKKVRHE